MYGHNYYSPWYTLKWLLQFHHITKHTTYTVHVHVHMTMQVITPNSTSSTTLNYFYASKLYMYM